MMGVQPGPAGDLDEDDDNDDEEEEEDDEGWGDDMEEVDWSIRKKLLIIAHYIYIY